MRGLSVCAIILCLLAVANATATLRHLRRQHAAMQSQVGTGGGPTQTTAGKAKANPAPSTATQGGALSVPLKTWADLTKTIPNDEKKIGMEFEINWITGTFKPEKNGAAKETGITASGGARIGHLPFYKGGGDWKNWEIHLDGAIIPEFVLNPVSQSQLLPELNRLKTFLRSIKMGSTDWASKISEMESKGWLLQDNQNIPAEYYRHFKAFSARPTGYLHPHGAMQATSTYTIKEMKASKGMAGVVYKFMQRYPDGKSSELDTDEQFRDRMYKYEFKNGLTPESQPKYDQSIIVKHMAEQLGPEGAKTVNLQPDPPANFPAAGIDKIKAAYKVHTKANKVSPLFTRHSDIAYLIEIRKMDGDSTWFNEVKKYFKSEKDTDASGAKNYDKDFIKNHPFA